MSGLGDVAGGGYVTRLVRIGTPRQRSLRSAQVPGDELTDQTRAISLAHEPAQLFPVRVGDSYDAVRGVGVLRSADHALRVGAAYATCPAIRLTVHMHTGRVLHMHSKRDASLNSQAQPSRHTENRHTANGAPCHHFQRYGLTCGEYDDLRARAGGRCEICERDEREVPGRALLIDHVHDRGNPVIRGLLCARCNAVMACHDGTKRWGPASLPFTDRATAYHRRATSQS